VKFKRLKRTPFILALSVLALVCGALTLHLDFLERLERMTYDLRVRAASEFPAPAATNLAFVSMEESSIKAVKSGRVNGLKLGYSFGLLWPRQVYARLVNELAAEGAETVGFDVLFGELRPDHPSAQTGATIYDREESDVFFARQMRQASNVVLAITPDVAPPSLFATNALTLGDISTEKDPDGILRRVKAFHDFRQWHPLFTNAAAVFGIDLDTAQFTSGKILLPQTGTTNVIEVSVNAENNFQLADFVGDKLPAGMAPTAKAFTTERIWHMGIVLAAQQLKLNLAQAVVDLPRGKIILSGPAGVQRVIPVDENGYFLVDWRLTPNDSRLLRMPIENLLWQDRQRLLGETNGLRDDFRGKLVIVGSAAQGNDLTDRGATPLERDTLLVSKHWNVANSVITGQFIRRASLPLELAIIIVSGLITALLTLKLRAVTASLATFLFIAAYTGFTFYAFIEFRLWLPLVFPVLGAILVEHVSLVTYRVIFEEREQRRVKSIFSKIVAPEIVNELLQAEKLSLGGAHREITVFFADVRGFTTLTDQMQESVTEFIRHNQVNSASGEKLFEESARETLETVNQYLALVAEAIKKHGGTLDKYIGDCVMAFWNAPVADEKHALNCVLAAIDAQRAIAELNHRRLAKNVQREFENSGRAAAGLPPKPMLAALQLGTGINTGYVTTGLMGSEEHGFNYTVFGREVNLASRLEGVSGSGRIIISVATHAHLQRCAPELAAGCIELESVTVKGIRNTIRIYEVPWQQNK
jgi:class 3 adenylate cyclase/CHASE2 domain-containing sensor protein